MLYPDSFLEKLQSQKIQTKYARITSLNWAEEPVEEIQGQVTGGSANIDGNSAIRTTISLSLIAPTADVQRYKVALRSKVSIEIGLENRIDNKYPSIIWFKQGIFIVTSFNSSIGTNQSSISLSGKDKGCLLNGEISGSIPASTDFGNQDFYENTYSPVINISYQPGVYYYKDELGKYRLDYSQKRQNDVQYFEKISSVKTSKVPIKEIIRNVVHVYGHEPWQRIIIKDLELKGSQLLEYRGDKPIYLLKKDNKYEGISFSLVDGYEAEERKSGETIGYKSTELTYPGELVAGVGETVVTILDKIKNVLGNFEYFFDVYGNFIFQAKHDYQAISFTKVTTDGSNDVMIDGSIYNNRTIYSFNDLETGTQISHTPNITNLRNDYSIWGERTLANNQKKQGIHLRYALQAKPQKYTTINGFDERANITYIASDETDERLIQANQLLINRNEALTQAETQFQEAISEQDSNLLSLRSKISNSLMNLYAASVYEPTEEVIEAAKNLISETTRLSKFGWFDNFVKQYNQIIYKLKVNLGYSNNLIEKLVQNNPDINISLIAPMTKVLPPQKEDSAAGYYLWYNRILDSSGNEYLSNEEVAELLLEYSNYDVICYYGYNVLVKYYTQLLEELTNKKQLAFDSNDLQEILQESLDIAQCEIYLLYINTFAYIYKDSISASSEINGSLSIDGLSLKIIQEDLYFDDSNSSSDITSSTEINTIYIKEGIMYNFGRYYSAYSDFVKVGPFGFNSPMNIDYQINISQYIFNDVKSFYNSLKVLHQTIAQIYLIRKDAIEKANSVYESSIGELRNSLYESVVKVNWRELIYQMARDYFDYYQNPKIDYQQELYNSNQDVLLKTGLTGYEVFYTDMLSFWRTLYYSPLLEKDDYDIEEATLLKVNNFNLQTLWNNAVEEDPTTLDFWLDLSEGSGELSYYSISAIGDRLKATKNSAIKALYYKEIPNIVFFEQDDIDIIENDSINTYSYFQLGGPLSDAYTISAQGKSAFDMLQEQLYKFAYCVENISITTIPIYTLQPNYQINVSSIEQNLNGQYIITRITIPFTYNGTMSISATKAVPYLGING